MGERNRDGRRIWLRRLVYVAVAAVTMGGSYLWGRRVDPPPPALDAADVARLTGAAAPPEKMGGGTPYWRIERGEDTLYAAETSTGAPEVLGYGGAFDLLVVIDAEGNFERVVLIRHNETPSYVTTARDFLSSFVGLPPTAPLRPGEDVDAITRATVTSEAFAAAARVTGRKLLAAALGRDVEWEEEETGWDWPWALASAAFLGVAAWARRRPPELLRVFLAAAAVGVLGFWAGRFVSIGDVGRLALWKFPPFAPRLSLYVLLGGAGAVALFWGNVYCGWVCPFGACAELLYKLPGKKLRVTPRFARRLSDLRFIILCLIVATFIATRDLGVASYEPFDDLFAYAAGGMTLVFLVAVLATSVFHYRFFCRYLCAAGALLGEMAAAGRRHTIPGCRACGRCAEVCPAGAVVENREKVYRALCFECGRCGRVCEAETGSARADD